MKLILGSSSPSRAMMLERITDIKPIIIPPDIDETSLKLEMPRQYAVRMAENKRISIMQKIKDIKDLQNDYNLCIICCDTVCSRGRIILPKAENDEDVKYCMKLISGRNHDVFTAISAIFLKDGKIINKISQTKVKFKLLSDMDISDMIKSKNGIGKAGGYGINGFAESFILSIHGSYSGVVGFPLYHIRNILKTFKVI